MGIAAMASLHLGVAFLLSFALRSHSRIVAGLPAGFGAVSLLGSAQLSRHYAVDGYTAILGVPVIWSGVGRIVEVLCPAPSGGAEQLAPRATATCSIAAGPLLARDR